MPERTLLRATPLDPEEDAAEPQGYGAVELSEEARTACEAWIKNHLESLETALAEIHGRFEEERNQLEGHMPGGDYPYPGAFRVNVPLTKKKVREIANRMKQAYLDADPIWAIVSPTLGLDLAAQIEKALDHQVDNELEAADDLSQTTFEAVLHGAGVLEPGWLYGEDVVHDVAAYEGFDGLTAQSLVDLTRFEEDYPDWQDNTIARRLHAKLRNGQRVHHEISYRTTTVNRPTLTHIPIKDVRAYPHLNNWHDLHRSPLYGYVKTYSRDELETLAADGTLDEDALVRVFPKADSDNRSAQDAMESHDVLRATIRYQLPSDDEPTRYKVWYDRRSSRLLRVRRFPWWDARPDLIFFHTRQEEPGLFKRGIAWDLKDTHTAANVTFNLYLNGADMANAMRWKAKSGSLAEQHILTRRWSPHLTMPWKTDPNEVEALATPTSHLGPLVQGFELMRRQSDEETQTSSLQSGRESPTDPTAPAAKTALLLREAEPNTKEYLRSLEPGFRQAGRWILWLFYQGMQLGWIEKIPGFPELPPETLPELAGQLQPRAILFESDRSTRLEADNMVLGWVTKLAPQAVPQVLRKAISHVSSDWSKEVDTLPLEQPAMPGAPGAPAPTNGAAPNRLQGLVPTASTNGAPPELAGALR